MPMLYLQYEWLLLNVIADDIVLMLDSVQQWVSFREQHVRGIVSDVTQGHIQLSTQSFAS